MINSTIPTATTTLSSTVKALSPDFTIVHFLPLDDLDLTGSAILNYIYDVNTADYLNVSGMAARLRMDRRTAQRRLTKYEKKGYLSIEEISCRKTNVILSNEIRFMIETVREINRGGQPVIRETPVITDSQSDCGILPQGCGKTPHNKTSIKQDKDLVVRKDAAEANFNAVRRFRAFKEKFHGWWTIENVLEESALDMAIEDHIQHAIENGYWPSYAGCQRFLQSQIDITERNLFTRLSADNLSEAKRSKLDALTRRNLDIASDVNFKNFESWKEQKSQAA